MRQTTQRAPCSGRDSPKYQFLRGNAFTVACFCSVNKSSIWNSLSTCWCRKAQLITAYQNATGIPCSYWEQRRGPNMPLQYSYGQERCRPNVVTTGGSPQRMAVNVNRVRSHSFVKIKQYICLLTCVFIEINVEGRIPMPASSHVPVRGVFYGKQRGRARIP